MNYQLKEGHLAELESHKQRLEEINRKEKRNTRIVWGVYSVVALTIIISAILGAKASGSPIALIGVMFYFLFIIFLTFIAVVIYMATSSSAETARTLLFEKRKRFFKEILLPDILQTVNSNFQFQADKNINEKEFLSLGIYGRPNIQPIIEGEDYFSGFIRKVKVEFSEILLSYTDFIKNGERVALKNRRSGIVFKGLVIKAEFNKYFQGVTKMLTISEKKSTRVFRKLSDWRRKAQDTGEKLERVKTENVEFNKVFEVYSSDEVEARYILSLTLMEQILRLRETFGNCRIDIAMVDSYMYVAINWGLDLFEAPSVNYDFRSNPTYFDKYVNQIQLCCDLVETLDLNTRIWTRV